MSVKITDFGLALDMKKKSDSDSTFIMGVGSPAYMSPEQIKDYPLNGQTDLYSLGTVMFELLTGRQPFRAKNRASLMYKIINMDPEAVSTLNPSVPGHARPDHQAHAREGSLHALSNRGAVRAGPVLREVPDPRRRRLGATHAALQGAAFRARAFTDFENDEIWEILRISHWRAVHEVAARSWSRARKAPTSA